jgi:hypothetical protein
MFSLRSTVGLWCETPASIVLGYIQAQALMMTELFCQLMHDTEATNNSNRDKTSEGHFSVLSAAFAKEASDECYVHSCSQSR